MAKIIPTILTANEREYEERLLKAQTVSDLIQVDLIDGKFANNLTVGVETIKKYETSSKIEVQLMVIDPIDYIEDLGKIDQVLRIIFPFEIKAALADLIDAVKKHNKQVGISLNPNTPVTAVHHLFHSLDLLLLLAVEPGFSGQSFQPHVLEKVVEVKKLAPGFAVEIDGGITLENINKAAQSGADFLAVNSALYKAPDFNAVYEKLAKLATVTS